MAWVDDDQRVGGEAVDCAMHRRAAETGHALQFLDGQKMSRFELAIDQELLDPLIGELELVDAVSPRGRIAPLGVDNFESAFRRTIGFPSGSPQPRPLAAASPRRQ
jgi:hypothetical protein